MRSTFSAALQAWREIFTEDVRRHAAEQGIAEEAALKKGVEAESGEFTEEGSELYVKA